MRIFSDTLDFNEVYYVQQSVYYDSLDYEMVLLINKDTVQYYKNELYSSDSIYDMNNDQKDDLCVVYQSTNGFITCVYLFDAEKNALKTTPLDFHNYVPIDKNHFFLVNKNYFVWEFRRHQWKEMEISYIQSIYVDFSHEKRKYFKIENQDTIQMNKNQITKMDLKVLNGFIFGD